MSYVDPDNDPALHRLEGSSGDQVGGLIIMKKTATDNSDQHSFKKPTASLLGLDKLAAMKRKQDGMSDDKRKKSKVMSYRDNDDSESDSSDSSDEERKSRSDHKKERHYRQSNIETPSHPGGVPREYKAKQEDRHRKDREKGVHASSKDKHKDRERDRDRDRERHRDRRKDRDKRRGRGTKIFEGTLEIHHFRE